LAQVPFADQLRFVTGQGDEMAIYLPWQMIFYLVTGTLTGIIVSLFTRGVAKNKLNVFYALIRTPVQSGEKITTPCTIPEGAVVPDRRKLFPNTNIEIPVPSRTSVIGFLIGWICVVVLVGAVYLITQ
jgi:hypothetical protein